MKRIILYIALTLSALPIMAQTEKQLTVSEIRQQTVLNEPLTLQKGYFKAISQFNYIVFSTERYNNNWEKVPSYGYLSNSFIVPFSISYGLSNNLQINISTGYEYRKASSGHKSIDYYSLKYSDDFKRSTIENGFHDISIGATYKINEKKNNRPIVGAIVYFTKPIGKAEPSSSDNGKTIYGATSAGCYEIGGGVLVKKVVYPFSVSGILSYSYSFPTDLKLNYNDTIKTHLKYGDVLNCNANLNYMVCDWISIGNSLSYTYNEPGEINGIKADYNTVYLKYAPSLTFQIKNVRLTQGISFYLTAKNANTNPLAYTTLAIKI